MYENKVGGEQISPVQTVRPVSCRLKTLLQMSKVDHTISFTKFFYQILFALLSQLKHPFST